MVNCIMATETQILPNPRRPKNPSPPNLPALYTCRESSTNQPVFSQNKPNFKMGNIDISTATTKAYANEQRTMSNERYSKQTQSKPIWRIPK